MTYKKQDSKQRFENIDLLKVIAILMVISLHVPLFFTNFIELGKSSLLVQYCFRLISEGVLIFILINGFLIINKPFDMNKHIKKMIRVFFIMLVWAFINVVVKTSIKNINLSIWEVIKEVLNINISNTYNGPLWFLQNLLGLYVVFPILKYVHDNNKKLYNYLFITVAFFSIGINLMNILLQLINSFINEPGLNTLIINNFVRINPYSNIMFLFYFMLGGYVFEYKDIFKKKKNVIKYSFYGIIAWVIAIGYGIAMSYLNNKTYTNNYNYSQVFLIITTLGLFAFSTLYADKKNNIFNKFILSVGNNTMGIYLLHTIYISIIETKIININTLSFFQRLLVTIIVFIIS